MNSSTWRRLVASVAATGVAIAMSVTASSAPVHAANVAQAIPVAPPGALAPIFHARGPATSGNALAVLPNITCYFMAHKPLAQGDRANSGVYGGAAIACVFDFNGATAPVPSINLTAALSLGSQIVDIKTVANNGWASALVDVFSAPCLHGDWTSSASVGVTFPPGYTPPSDFASTADSATLSLGDCPNDYVEVPDVLGLSLSRAKTELSQVWLNGAQGSDMRSCDVATGTIASQSPGAGNTALIGSTVVLRRSSGRPSTPCQ